MREIFQIDRPDLDFGIYRILNSREAKINDFLNNRLPQKIQEALSDSRQQNSVYSHLLTFFARYYDEGDFISQRRYQGNQYAIPYNGEEVVLHWANKDQYYTKSSENFSHYRFTLSDGKTVEFRLVEADTAKDNRKDSDKRVFVLAKSHEKIEIDENGDEIRTTIAPTELSDDGNYLTIRFCYQESKQKQSDCITQAVDTLKSDEICQKWTELFSLAPTEKNASRTLLEKHLTDYTAKNSKDYFIHKDLGGFLTNELDFYIKNELMNLANLQAAEAFSELEANFKLIKTFRAVALQIIDFLAQLENFQKKLWLKKKFVSQAYYLITLDKIDPKFYPQIAENQKQLDEWQRLFNFHYEQAVGFSQISAYPHLVVDTSLYPAEFQAELVFSLSDLDEQTSGVLIHSDNFQALNLLQARYKEQVKCIYIDPPYNTGGDGFIYKDNYKHSSWASLIHNRLTLAKPLLNQAGVFFQSIDDNEQSRLRFINEDVFGEGNFLNLFVKKNSGGQQDSKYYATIHEYLYSYAKSKNNFQAGREDKTEGNYPYLDKVTNLRYKTQLLRKWGDKSLRSDRPNLFYPIYFHQATNTFSLKRESLSDVEIYPMLDVNTEGRWRWSKETMIQNLNLLECKKIGNDYVAYEKIYENSGDSTKPFSTWIDNVDNSTGKTLIKNLFKFDIFSYPKATDYIAKIIKFSGNETNSLILDYFAGSGTTAHAVINLNREDGGSRKYILVEQGEYFDTVLKPRVQKVIYSENWKDGKPVKNDQGSFNGVSQIVKVLKLESYEDTLNNLQLQAGGLFDFSADVNEDYLLNYMLDIESRASLLSVNDFAKPFDYQLKIASDSAGAYQVQKIDLVETFNYLIGLRVKSIDDQRDKRGYVLVEGDLPNGESTLIVWRDMERLGYEDIATLFDKLGINPRDSRYDLIYLNGDHCIATVPADSDEGFNVGLKLRPIEPEFLGLMFDV
ncbi:hypothetical protein B0187_08925 [Haemophilus paracuniculus]|uniref:site-specific DNA-methyltransferase (adenine-specific) n=1 Tax=Haemophilus paracuniculus TaxID=734 RepID=A0A1T0AQJ4_9PAST|nr:site-specific DNA-methyltransferase [Haemophilus paracuniculus]OOR98404.1 hypothetical protein B0187_08925 [Haemophilus paracuniculus]